MRDIKFRAWDGEAMYPHEDIGEDYYFSFGKEGLVLELNEQFHECGSGVAEEYWQYVEKKGAKFMQFTGLTDKNGVDIYEGDVLSMWYAPMATCIGVIEFIDGAFYFHTKDAKPEYCLLFEISEHGNEVNIIGNIHSNPELLEK